MKKIFFLTLLAANQYFANAQNVGIGTNAPAFRLDVKGSINTDSFYRISSTPVLAIKNSNTFIGRYSGISISTGNNNTGAGENSLHNNNIGNNNTAIGRNALYANTEGNNNTATGADALRSNSNGVYNVANGFQSLYSNTIGNFNTATGTSSLFSNTTGSFNTATGQSALSTNTTGSENTANGYYALRHNTTGNYNTATGSGALEANTIGAYNTATGNYALYNNTGGSNNVANGFGTLTQNVNGYNNTGIGFQALNLVNNSSNNTALGHGAGYGINHGWNNTFIGAGSNVTGAGFFNCIALGNSATATASNQARIGNSSTVSIGGFTNWTNISDGRFKKNIKEDVKGLDFIMKLCPVTYNLDVSGISEKLNESRSRKGDEQMLKSIAEKEMTKYSGFVAQEVEDAAKGIGYDFSGVDKPKNANDFYGLRYAEFVVPLVKAMQEQQQLINDLQKRMQAQEEQNKILIQLLKTKK